MAPVFDMFNHDPSASTVHGFQETNECLHLVTLQAWESGSEVRLNYGPLSNSRLLLLHGFCLPDNLFDAVELWAKMEEGAPDYAVKRKVIFGPNHLANMFSASVPLGTHVYRST